MALNDMGNGGFYMPVAPAAPAYGYPAGGYGGGNGIFGGDGAWWLLLLVLLGGGMWGSFGGFGMGGMMGAGMWGMDMLYPWLNNSQHMSDGFRDQLLQTTVTGIGDRLSALSTQMGAGFADVTAAVSGAQSAISQQLYANQIADMERSYAAQTATTQGLFGIQTTQLTTANDIERLLAQYGCDSRLASCETRNLISREAAANRAAGNADTQRILDKLCQLELDGYKRQVADEQRENANLRSENQYLKNEASRVAQTAVFERGLTNEVDALYNRLKNCPVNTVPVYGNQPVFTCAGPNLGNGYVCPGAYSAA